MEGNFESSQMDYLGHFYLWRLARIGEVAWRIGPPRLPRSLSLPSGGEAAPGADSGGEAEA